MIKFLLVEEKWFIYRRVEQVMMGNLQESKIEIDSLHKKTKKPSLFDLYQSNTFRLMWFFLYKYTTSWSTLSPTLAIIGIH
jgi:hypothetical protein